MDMPEADIEQQHKAMERYRELEEQTIKDSAAAKKIAMQEQHVKKAMVVSQESRCLIIYNCWL